MSASSPRGQLDPNPEPFGQVGVSQYIMPVLSCASLAVAMLSLLMWYRSHRVIDRFMSEQPGGTWLVNSNYGRLLIVAQYRPQRAEELRGQWNYSSPPRRPINPDPWEDSLWKRIGIEWRAEPLPLRQSSGGGGFWIRIRWWFIAIVASVFPMIRVIQVWSRRKRFAAIRENGCPECGGDLRASQGYCPRCGRAVVKR